MSRTDSDDLEFSLKVTKTDGGVWAKVKPILNQNGWETERLEVSSPPGWPDVIAMRKGVVIFIELKRLTDNRVHYRPRQHGRLLGMRENGIPTFVGLERDGVVYLLEPRKKYSDADFVPQNVIEKVLFSCVQGRVLGVQ